MCKTLDLCTIYQSLQICQNQSPNRTYPNQTQIFNKLSMSVPFVSRDLFTASPSRFTLYYFDGFPPQNPKVFSPPFTCRHLQNYSNFHVSKRNLHFLNSLNYVSLKTHHFCLRVSESESVVHRDGVANSSFNLESLLSMVESLCIFSSAVISIGFAINGAVPSSKRTVLSVMGNGVFACGVVALVFGVWIGMWIRRRQWRRICRETVKGGMEINLLERIEKLEEDLKSSATIVRVLSRQLEKLGIRFRVTRKSLKEPIAEVFILIQVTDKLVSVFHFLT